MYELIAHQKLESTASAITFSNIPQIYTDLYVLVSVRSTNSDDGLFFKFNNTTANTSWRNLLGYGTGQLTQTGSGWLAGGGVRSGTASTFTNVQVYISDYTSGLAKIASVDSTSEENGSTAYQFLVNNLWNDTAAVNRIDFYLQTAQLAAGSSATLYGVNRKQALGTSPQATGGYITYANDYWYHTFTGSGSFIPFNTLSTEYLVVAGGGGGGYQHGGGGGAGGFRTGSASLTANTNYPVVIGAGGISNTNNSAPGDSGNASSFNSLSSTGGGGGGDRYSSPGASGGSGGGGGYFTAGGAGTSGQGNNGGTGDAHGGGGGGAGAPGIASTGTVAGNGGAGLPWLNGLFYAGGGGGGNQGTSSDPASLGGIGGGGNGSGIASGIAGTPNTGGGGGGSRYPGYSNAHGGSGVVIIRYRAD